MRLVVDASVLVAELLRRRGRALIAHPVLQLAVAQDAWDEARHELGRRALAIQQTGRLPGEAALELV